MWQFIKGCYIKMGIPVLIALALGYFVKEYSIGVSWISFIIKGFVIVFIYAILVGLIGTSKEEKKLFISKSKIVFAKIKNKLKKHKS